jgi:hypothetical protein
METAEEKILCSTCEKSLAILMCLGCEKDFCYRHVAEHRQELNKQMDEIATNHDQLQQTIANQEAEPNCHPLMKRIDEWEQQSIDKIRQAAEDARKQLLIILGTHRTQVTKDLASFTTELSTVRKEGDYVETDLTKWTEKLENLKADLTAADTIGFASDNDEISLIPKYFINDASADIFYQTINDVQISEARKIVTHGPTNDISAARCRREYSRGQHRCRFRIEQLHNSTGFSCGIVSKNTPIHSIISTTVNYNAYGSSGIHQRLNHKVLCSFDEQNFQFKTNCNYEILIDCTQQTIRLTNEQSGRTHMLNINLATCSFPWQFFIALSYANDRVCLY